MLLDVFSFVAVGDYVKDIPDSDFSAGEKQIFRMLSAFTSSGCSGQFLQAISCFNQSISLYYYHILYI